MDSDTNNRLNQWLVAEMGFYHGYHNHKETMAWAATAFYIPGIIILGYQTRGITDCWIRLLVFFLIIMAAVLVGFFVCRQFHWRRIATYTVYGLRITLLRLYSGNKELSDEFEKAEKCEGEYWKNKEWPKLIKDSINSAEQSPEFGKYMKWTEIITYAAIGLATVIALCLLGSSLCS